MRQVEQFKVGDIATLPGRRSVCPVTVGRLSESIKLMGLRTPLTVRIVDDFVDDDGVIVDGQPVLVTGAHRLEAVKSLGWDSVECFVFDGDDEIDAQLWEIAENLHRADLSAQQRSDQIAEWVRLMGEKRVSRQVDAKPQGGRPESGVRAASRDLGINEASARRALRIAAISAEAKAAARDAGLDDNQSMLERIARADDQLAEVEVIALERNRPREVVDNSLMVYRALMDAWKAAPADVQQQFMDRVGLVWGERKTAP